MATDDLPLECWLIITSHVEEDQRAYFRLCMVDRRCKRSEMIWRTCLVYARRLQCRLPCFSATDLFVHLTRIDLSRFFETDSEIHPVQILIDNKSNFDRITAVYLPTTKAASAEILFKRMPRLSNVAVYVDFNERLDQHWSFLRSYGGTMREFTIQTTVYYTEEIDTLAEYFPKHIQFFRGPITPNFRAFENLNSLHFYPLETMHPIELDAVLPQAITFDDVCCPWPRTGEKLAIRYFRVLTGSKNPPTIPDRITLEAFGRRVKRPLEFIRAVSKSVKGSDAWHSEGLARLICFLIKRHNLDFVEAMEMFMDYANYAKHKIFTAIADLIIGNYRKFGVAIPT